MFAFYGGEGVYHRYILVLHLYNLFVFLWLVNFIIALGQCTLAGAFASYYWARKKPSDIPAFPLRSSFIQALRCHTGSLAFGSLIVTVAQIIQIEPIAYLKRLKGSKKTFSRFVSYCLWWSEFFLKFLNRNAYIMMAIYRKNFCASSKDGFLLLRRNVIWVADLDKVFFHFSSYKIPVIQEEVPSLYYFWVPLVTVIFGSYMIARCFCNVHAMCVDTLFLCFCEDLERNDGSPSRPYDMSPGLHKILRKREDFFYWTVDSLTHFSISTVCVRVRTFESEYR